MFELKDRNGEVPVSLLLYTGKLDISASRLNTFSEQRLVYDSVLHAKKAVILYTRYMTKLVAKLSGSTGSAVGTICTCIYTVIF
jgi:hypothetical protein